MNLRKIVSIIYLLLIVYPFIVQSRTVGCDIVEGGSEGKSLQVKCGGIDGFVKNEAPLEYLRIIVTKAGGQQNRYGFINPPGSVKNYYKGIENNSWVISNIPGLQYGDTIEVAANGYGLDPQKRLLDDWYNNRLLKNSLLKSKNINRKLPTGYSCQYVSGLEVAKMGSCGNFCIGKAHCTYKGMNTQVRLLCKASGNDRCPTPDQCASEDISLQKVFVYGERGGFIGELSSPSSTGESSNGERSSDSGDSESVR